MFSAKKHLDRRTFLRGMGATVALPLLDAMIPARTLLALTAARPVPRLAFVYFPHGAIMDEWTPASAGRTPLGRILEPLAPFDDRLTIVSGLENRHAYGPVHAITPGTWLSGTSRRASAMRCTAPPQTSLLQITSVATRRCRRSLSPREAPRRSAPGSGKASTTRAMARRSHSVRSGAPVPMEFRPRAVFDTLFHRTLDTRERRTARQASSISSPLTPRVCEHDSALRIAPC